MSQGINWGLSCTDHKSTSPSAQSCFPLPSPFGEWDHSPESSYTKMSLNLFPRNLIYGKWVWWCPFKSENWGSERLIMSPRHIAKVTSWSDSPARPCSSLQPLIAEVVLLWDRTGSRGRGAAQQITILQGQSLMTRSRSKPPEVIQKWPAGCRNKCHMGNTSPPEWIHAQKTGSGAWGQMQLP